jgi:type II secretory pathway pseudopilin PulG
MRKNAAFGQISENRRGMTIVETLVAVLILGLLVGSMLGAFVVARLSVTRGKHQTKAMNLLRSKMEWVKAQNPDTIEGWITVPLAAEDDVDDAVGGDELLDDTRTTTVTQDADGNLIVTITMNWTKRGWGSSIPKGTALDPDQQLVTVISSRE